jgi:hypothetical protein
MPDVEPRIWRVRIWRERSPFAGTGFVCKVPTGAVEEVASTLARATATGAIKRFQLSPVPARVMKGWTKTDREALQRFDPAFEEVLS